METTLVLWGYIVIMEKRMEASMENLRDYSIRRAL